VTLHSVTFPRHVHHQTPSVGSVQICLYSIYITQSFLQMGVWWIDWWGVHLLKVERLLNFDWNPSVQLLPLTSLHSVRHLRLWVTGKFVLCANVLSTIQGLQSPDFTHSPVLDLCMTHHALFKWGFRVILGRIPGSVGSICGKEAAGAMARDATTHGTLIPGVFSLDSKTTLHQGTLSKWQQAWDDTQGNKLQDVKPMVLPWRPSCRSVLCD
jgi:hypothetical protein